MTILGPGIYEQLVTEELSRLLGALDEDLVSREPLDIADAHEVLSRHLGRLAQQALRALPTGSPEALLDQVRLANKIATAMERLQAFGRGSDEGRITSPP